MSDHSPEAIAIVAALVELRFSLQAGDEAEAMKIVTRLVGPGAMTGWQLVKFEPTDRS